MPKDTKLSVGMGSWLAARMLFDASCLLADGMAACNGTDGRDAIFSHQADASTRGEGPSCPEEGLFPAMKWTGETDLANEARASRTFVEHARSW